LESITKQKYNQNSNFLKLGNVLSFVVPNVNYYVGEFPTYESLSLFIPTQNICMELIKHPP